MQVTIIGGGASGLMAAITAARNGHSVTLLERQARVGRQASGHRPTAAATSPTETLPLLVTMGRHRNLFTPPSPLWTWMPPLPFSTVWGF